MFEIYYKDMSKITVSSAMNAIPAIANTAGYALANLKTKDTSAISNAIQDIYDTKYATGSYDNLEDSYYNTIASAPSFGIDDVALGRGEYLGNALKAGFTGLGAFKASGGNLYGIGGSTIANLITGGVGFLGGIASGIVGYENAKKELAQLQADREDALAYNNINLNYATDNTRNTLYNNLKMNIKAFGGELTPFVNQGDFTNGVKYIENGGTHEENPNMGVQMGVDNEGIPNKVEEGEVIWNDYVFSKRLTPTEAFLKEAGLGKKYVGKTYAEIAKDISKESENRPFDTISRNGLNDRLAKLAMVQELSRAIERQDEQFAEDEVMYDEAMNSAADGGPLKSILFPSLNTEDDTMLSEVERRAQAEKNKRALKRKEEIKGWYKNAKQRVIDAFSPRIDTVDVRELPQNFNSINSLLFPALNSSTQVDNELKKGGKINIKPSKRGTFTSAAKKRGMGVQEFASKVLANPNKYSEAMRKKAQFAKNAAKWHAFGGNLFPYGGDLYDLIYDPESPYGDIGNSLLNPDDVEINNNIYIPDNIFKDLKTRYKGRVRPMKIPATNYAITNVDEQEVDEPEVQSVIDRYKQGHRNDVNAPWYNPQVKGEGVNHFSTMMSGAQVLSDLLGGTNEEDYSDADIIGRAARNIREVSPTPIGGYMRFSPYDINYDIARLDNINAGNIRAMLDLAAGNRGAAMAGLYGSNARAIAQRGDLRRKALEYNDNRENAVAQFNTGIDQINAQQALQAAIQNQSADYQRGQLKTEEAKLRDVVKSATSQAKSSNITNWGNNMDKERRDRWNAQTAMEVLKAQGFSPDDYYNYLYGVDIEKTGKKRKKKESKGE